jgi:hypothetical protein
MTTSVSTRIQINAYDPTGVPSVGTFDPRDRRVKRFALAQSVQPPKTFLAPTAEPELTEWQNSEVGWGLVVPDTWGTRLPEPLRALLDARQGAPVLHFKKGWDRAFTFLRNEAQGRDVAIAGPHRGTGPGRLPQYLLICGTPEEVPWRLQFILNANRSVGRLPLSGEGLRNYVQALLTGFPGEPPAKPADPHTTVTWATDLGEADITRLMRTHIAAKVHEQYAHDDEIGSKATFLDGQVDPAKATASSLIDELKQKKPGMIVTTSHGLTGPTNDRDALRATLGLPVDQGGTALDPVSLLKNWSPSGAIWYSHACCSAGAESPSAFEDLFEPDTSLSRILNGIASAGSVVAPLPMQLLGHTRPCRAFIGHVEPTFDWTLRNPGNRQVVTQPIVEALYRKLFRVTPTRMPSGLAFRDVYANIGSNLASWENARSVYDTDTGPRNVEDLLMFQLAGRDLQSLVILGDPATMLPL